MNGSFRFARFHDQFLLTNDAGRFAFLPPEDFSRFVHHQLPHDSETWQRLQENFFCYDTDREVYLRSVMAAVREIMPIYFHPQACLSLLLQIAATMLAFIVRRTAAQNVLTWTYRPREKSLTALPRPQQSTLPSNFKAASRL